MEIEHSIDFGNGYVQVPQPKNFESAEVDVVFSKDLARASLANLQMVWWGETAKKIFAVYESGFNGGKGVAHGLPYRIKVCGSNITFDLVLILGHSSAKFSCDKVEVPAWVAQGADWFEKQTQAYSFWYLMDIGQITQTDYKKTPYVITAIPNYTQVVSLQFQNLILLLTLYDAIVDLTAQGLEIAPGDIAESAIPYVGTPHIFVLVVHIISIILRIARIILNIVLLGINLKDTFDNIIQRKKYKLCMREQDLFRKMCDFLGLTFSSTIYGVNAPLGYGGKFEHATWMPAKIVMPNLNQTGFLDNFIDSLFTRPENEYGNAKSYGYFDGRFDEFISVMERKYNAEVSLRNGTLHFEEKHHWNNINPYQLPNTSDVGYTFNLPQPFRTNLSELAPYYEIAFQVDQSELNTIHKYRGTSAAVQILSPFPISKFSGWGQGQIIDLGSALAKRKEYLTKPEHWFDDMIEFIHPIIQQLVDDANLIIKGINIVLNIINALLAIFAVPPIELLELVENPIDPALISQRFGWMELSNDSFSIPKTFIGTPVTSTPASDGIDWELSSSSEADMSAISILNNFHGWNLATRGKLPPFRNQYLIWENNKTKFCCSDFAQIINSNILKTHNNINGKFDTMKWNLKKEIATDIVYRTNEIYLSGLTEKIIIDGTQ